MFDDPIIGGVETVTYHLEGDPLLVRGPHPRIGDESDLEFISFRDAEDLVFHRTRIGVYKDVKHINFPSRDACQDRCRRKTRIERDPNPISELASQ